MPVSIKWRKCSTVQLVKHLRCCWPLYPVYCEGTTGRETKKGSTKAPLLGTTRSCRPRYCRTPTALPRRGNVVLRPLCVCGSLNDLVLHRCLKPPTGGLSICYIVDDYLVPLALHECGGAPNRTRTGTALSSRRILSPLCLPISPSGLSVFLFRSPCSPRGCSACTSAYPSHQAAVGDVRTVPRPTRTTIRTREQGKGPRIATSSSCSSVLSGAAGETRTPDLPLTRRLLYQLS